MDGWLSGVFFTTGGLVVGQVGVEFLLVKMESVHYHLSFALFLEYVHLKRYLGGGFKYFLFSPLLGEDSHFD